METRALEEAAELLTGLLVNVDSDAEDLVGTETGALLLVLLDGGSRSVLLSISQSE